MSGLDEYSINIIKTMYDDCVSNLVEKTNSLILSSIKSNKNTIRSALNASAIKVRNDHPSVNILLDVGYIRCIMPGTYALTAKGAWYVESTFYNHNIDMILEHLDSKCYVLDSEKISEKNKIILFALLSARCFTDKTCAEYSTDETEKIFLQLLYNSLNFLTNGEYIKSSSFDSSSKASSKSELGKFTDKIDKLPSCTYLLFKAPGNRYYLDIVQNGKINAESLTSLFKIVFDGNINIDDVDKIVDFCKGQCMHLGYIYHLNKGESFSGSEIDTVIEECIMSAAGL